MTELLFDIANDGGADLLFGLTPHAFTQIEPFGYIGIGVGADARVVTGAVVQAVMAASRPRETLRTARRAEHGEASASARQVAHAAHSDTAGRSGGLVAAYTADLVYRARAVAMAQHSVAMESAGVVAHADHGVVMQKAAAVVAAEWLLAMPGLFAGSAAEWLPFMPGGGRASYAEHGRSTEIGRLISVDAQRADRPAPGRYTWPDPPIVPIIIDGLGAADLIFCRTISPSADLRFGCPPLPIQAGHTIPTRGAYFMQHTISIIRVDTQAEIPAASVELSIDADSHTWRFSATLLGVSARDAMEQAGGAPVELEITINATVWRVFVDEWAEDVSFARRAVKVAGRGLSSELAEPWQLPISAINSVGTVEQVMAELLPFGSGWSLAWGVAGVTAWPVPAGAFSVSNAAPIAAIHSAAQGVGLRLAPRRTTRVIDIVPRYPVLPWDYSTATPDLLLPRAAIISYSRRQVVPPQANAIAAHGEAVGGILGNVKRIGSAGDRTLPAHSHPLITHADAARLAGGRLLAGEDQPSAWRSFVVPFGGDYPLIECGQLVAIDAGAESDRATVSGVSLSVSVSGGAVSVRQSVSLGENTGNKWSAFKALIPGQPQLVGTITTAHGDDTATVALTGGGTVRARNAGSLTAGAAVFVQGGVINGPAPALAAYSIEV